VISKEMRIAHRLQELRIAAGLSQTGLANKSGVPVGSIRDVEQGKRLPGWPTLRRLSVALGVSLGAWDGLDDEGATSKSK
jgi:transcriptional regulator with XRE-family HTH domain